MSTLLPTSSRRVFFELGLFGLTASYLSAAEVWDKKPAAEWGEKDIEKLMNKSPWAKKFTVDTGRPPVAYSGAAPAGGARGGGGASRGPQGGGGNPDEAPPADAGGGGGMGAAAPEALVRWETALPILEAQKRPVPDAFKGNYALSIQGFPVGRGGPGGPGGAPGGPGGAPGGGAGPGGAGGPKGGGFNPEAMRAAQQQMFEQAKMTTRLERKGKDPIHPSVMSMNGRSLVMLFPQGSQPITLDDKDVTLVLKVGLPEMKAKFSLKEMVYMGKLEL